MKQSISVSVRDISLELAMHQENCADVVRIIEFAKEFAGEGRLHRNHAENLMALLSGASALLRETSTTMQTLGDEIVEDRRNAKQA